MSRAQRLLELIQILRQHRLPVKGSVLAEELGISLRTLYRDIAVLQEQGANIEGEAGIGYLMRPGFMLPPLMFQEEEIEVLVLGSRWVANNGDERLREAAARAISKISAVLPQDLQALANEPSLLVPSRKALPQHKIALSIIRQAIRTENKVTLSYRAVDGKESTRIIWPFALGYFEEKRILAAWCEKRKEYRHFRTDRISGFQIMEERYPRKRQTLLNEWREQELKHRSSENTSDEK